MKTIHIYSDESRHRNERFLLLGAFLIDESHIEIVKSSIKKLRSKYGYINNEGKKIDFLGEFKWTKISDKYFSVYQDLVDIFFSFIEKNIIRFCTMLIDTRDPVVLSYSNIKKEGYFKLLYQLYLHNSKIPAFYKIFPDKITNPNQHKVNFKVLRESLEASFKNKFFPLLNSEETKKVKNFIKFITPIDSKNNELIQMLDVVIGGIGYFQNQYFRKPNAKKAKINLMKHIFNKLIYSGFIKIISKKFMIAKSSKFNIWIFRPKNRRIF